MPCTSHINAEYGLTARSAALRITYVILFMSSKDNTLLSPSAFGRYASLRCSEDNKVLSFDSKKDNFTLSPILISYRKSDCYQLSKLPYDWKSFRMKFIMTLQHNLSWKWFLYTLRINSKLSWKVSMRPKRLVAWQKKFVEIYKYVSTLSWNRLIIFERLYIGL